MTLQQIIIANARKNNQVFELENKNSKVTFYIDKTNQKALVCGIETRVLGINEARQEFALLKLGCTVWQGESNSYYGGAHRIKLSA